MLKMPTDVEPEFAGSWEAFLELPTVEKMEPTLRSECFRILLKQAGVKIKTLKKVKDFFTVNKLYAEFSKTLTSKFLLTHLKPVRHSYEFIIDATQLTNLVHGVTVKGQVKLKAQRFDLDYLIRRMVDVKVLKEFPEALKLDSRKVTKDGKQVTTYTDRCPATIDRVKPWDEVTVVVNNRMKITIARLKGGYLAMKYEVYFVTEMPLYPNLKNELLALWRRASIGDLQ